jgi:hypothetical protein
MATSVASAATCHASQVKGRRATSAAREKSAASISRRRSTRSASKPLIGASTTRGSSWATKMKLRSCAEPVMA